MNLVTRFICTFFLFSSLCSAEPVRVAVAANFYLPMQKLAEMFEQQTGSAVQLSSGSTGSLYAQIENGAPYDVFLSADQRRPAALEASQLIAPGSRFTYASGRLVLWSPDAEKLDPQATAFTAGKFKLVAIANPKTAPYGQAAVEAMSHMGVDGLYKNKLVEGQSLSQTYQYLTSGVVEVGFLALSQVLKDGELASGSVWMVPDDYYADIHQDAVLLKAAEANRSARALIEFLKGDEARQVIREFGYRI